MDTLDIPVFLQRPPSDQPVHLLLANINRKHWRRIKTQRPEGETWATASLREVRLYDEASPIGSGRRLVWVREGRKWCKLCSLDGSKAKVTMSVWASIARRK